jgi:DNA replication factor GINS
MSMIGLDDLRKTLLSERETGKLTVIPHDIFDRAHATVASLLEKVYAIEDPLSDEARTLIEETVSIRETACDLFAIRLRKILSLAEGHAQGHYIDREEIKRMIPQEREMFEQVTSAIGTCQGVLVQNSSQTHLTIQPVQPVVSGGAAQEEAVQGPPRESPRESPRGSAPPATPSYTLVRILADLDLFMGIDGNDYDLMKGDIVMLPERNAEVLVGRNIALNMNVGK